jgi:splicing factor 3B subunit 4
MILPLQRNQDATLYVGGLDERCDDELVWELFVQAGPVVSVSMPSDKVTGRHQGFAFVEFRTEQDAEYAKKVMNMVKLFGKMLRVDNASRDKQQRSNADVGANLFIGNLSAETDEKVLYDTFSAFGGIISQPRIMRDPETGASKGFGFVTYDCFEASDMAIEAMHGQFFGGRPIVVQYSYKKDGAPGERHGGQAERLLAAAARNTGDVMRPHTTFGTAQGEAVSALPSVAMVGAQANTAPAPPMLPPTAILPASMAPPPLMGGYGMAPSSAPVPFGAPQQHGQYGHSGHGLPPPPPLQPQLQPQMQMQMHPGGYQIPPPPPLPSMQY